MSKGQKRIRNRLDRIYQALFDHFGPQHWWPGETRLEIMAGAILTQNTAWSNVERAIANLKKEKALTLEGLSRMRLRRLERLIRPSGYFRQKARRLKDFLAFLSRRHKGDLRSMSRLPWQGLRQELLAQKGIGPETADSILLYALGKPVFVVDAYTRRVGRRLGLFHTDDYQEIQDFFHRRVPRKTSLYNEWHALIVALGKSVCKTKPLCGMCPLDSLCGHKISNFEG